MKKLFFLAGLAAALWAAFKYRLLAQFSPVLDNQLKDVFSKLGFEKYAPVEKLGVLDFDWQNSFWKKEDFASPDDPASWQKMDNELMHKLQLVASTAPLVPRVGSGFRSVSHNAKIGGVSNSAHTLGFAADLSFDSFEDAKTWFKLLRQIGFRRLGFYAVNTRRDGFFIHVDIDDLRRNKPSALWFSDRYLAGHSTYKQVDAAHKQIITAIYNQT